ncbi:MAG: polysaccharide biosynthesis/export family protein [Bacteroidota bacterium]|nr:polysaccharide biosynthesis/export family protein [Bacteroidota bacterium]
MKHPHYLFILSFLFLSSCVSKRELTTFYDAEFKKNEVHEISERTEVTIQAQDLVNITISSFDEEVIKAFNQGTLNNQMNMNMQNQQNGVSNMFEYFSGYLVDDQGFIDFPLIGKIFLKNLTRREAKDTLQKLIAPIAKDVTVNLRFLNFKITILGEVQQPGIQRISNERISILEALGAAGDFTPYANRQNVLLIREKEGKRTFTKIDLQAKDIFTSPFFYLQQNDVIYVEPSKAKAATIKTPIERFTGIFSGLASLAALIISLNGSGN